MKQIMAALLLMVSGLFGCTAPEATNPADAVYLNGDIYTSNPSNPRVSAVAVSGNRFVYTGDDASSFIGPSTHVYDLAGQTVIPGIVDAHAHPGWVAVSGDQLLLDEADTKPELLAAIAKLVADNPDQETLLAGYWHNNIFGVNGPRKDDLDKIEPNRPLIILDDWAHTLWANSAALAQAGVTEDTPDVVPGFAFYQRDANGEATGWITESAAISFQNHFKTVSPEVEVALLAYLNYYQALGITTVFDAGNFGMDREFYAAISRMDKAGTLPVRYHGSYTLFLPDDLAHAVETLTQLGQDFNSDNVRIDTLKVFFDAVLETRTAAMSYDYLDTPGNSGEALLSREQVHQLILDLDAAGLHFHGHAVGDRATTTLLDGIEDAHESLGRAPTSRVSICHLEVVKPADIARFETLGVIANFTPQWWWGDDRSWVEQGIGDDVLAMQRGQSFIDAGVMVTFSSDITDKYGWQSERANPYLGMEAGHNRQNAGVGPDGKVFIPPSERVSRADLLKGYTANGAYQLGRDDELGSIAVGKRADLVVLNQDLFSVDRYAIHKTKPAAVIRNGKLVSGELPPVM